MNTSSPPRTRQTVIDAFAGEILAEMPASAHGDLPRDRRSFLDGLVSRALEATGLDEHARGRRALGALIVGLYETSPDGERFVCDPTSGDPLIVGGDGELVTLDGAEIATVGEGLDGAGAQYVQRYDYAIPLTGPQRDEHLSPDQYRIPHPRSSE